MWCGMFSTAETAKAVIARSASRLETNSTSRCDRGLLRCGISLTYFHALVLPLSTKFSGVCLKKKKKKKVDRPSRQRPFYEYAP